MMRNHNLWDSFGHAFAGLRRALRDQVNLRIHLGVTCAVIIVGLWLGLPLTDWAVLVLTIGLVLICEMVNSAIEVLVDLVSPEYHVLAGAVKDIAAGAVLLGAITSVIVGLLIIGPPLWGRLFGSGF